jgi:hypothetical protein
MTRYPVGAQGLRPAKIYRALKLERLRKSSRNQLKTDLFASLNAPLNLVVQY